MPPELQIKAMLLQCVLDRIDQAIYLREAEMPQMKKNRHLSKALNQQDQDQVLQPDYSELSHWHYDKNRKWHNLGQKGKNSREKHEIRINKTEKTTKELY